MTLTNPTRRHWVKHQHRGQPHHRPATWESWTIGHALSERQGHALRNLPTGWHWATDLLPTETWRKWACRGNVERWVFNYRFEPKRRVA